MKLKAALFNHYEPIALFARFSSDNTLLASRDQLSMEREEPHQLRLWNIEDWTQFMVFNDIERAIESLEFVPGKNAIIIGDEEADLQMWNTTTGAMIREFC